MHFLSNSLHNPTPLSSRIGPSLSVDTKRRYDRCDRLFIIYGILCKNLITESKGTRPPLAGALRPPLQGARGIPADPAVPSHSSARYARLWQLTRAIPLHKELSRRSFPFGVQRPCTLRRRTESDTENGEEARRGFESSPRRNRALCAERLDRRGSASSLRTPHCPPSGSTCTNRSPYRRCSRRDLVAPIRTGTVGRRGGGKDPREKRKNEEGCSVIDTKKGPPKRTFLWAMVSETGLEPVCPFS